MSKAKKPNEIREEVRKQTAAKYKEVIQEWNRFLESDEFQHNPECGTFLLAQHFAEWGRTHQAVTPEQHSA